ncbi:MAG: lysylphosphatidylglycerol synthase transmembrane domain-containing protein [Planctomycetota bacterium]
MKVLLSLAVALTALALLLAWGGVDPGDVLATLAGANLSLVALAFVVQGLIYVCRAVRLRVLLRGAGGADVSIRGLTAASAAWILDSHVLPAKVGEASLVLHLSRVGVRAEHGLIGLVVSRLLDLSTLLFVLGVACSAMAVAEDHRQLPWLQSLGLFALAAASVLGVVILRGEHLVRAGRGLAVRVLPRTLGERSGRFLARVEDALRVLPRRSILTAALLSLPVWACVLGVYAALGTGVGLEGLAAADLLFGASLAVLGSLVPINGFLGFGMLDMGWAWGFAAVGVPESHAVATGLAFHALYIVGVGILGAVGHAQLLSRKR